MIPASRWAMLAIVAAASIAAATAQTPSVQAPSSEASSQPVTLGVYGVIGQINQEARTGVSLAEAGRAHATAPAPTHRPRWSFGPSPLRLNDEPFEAGPRRDSVLMDTSELHSNIAPLNDGRDLTVTSLRYRF